MNNLSQGFERVDRVDVDSNPLTWEDGKYQAYSINFLQKSFRNVTDGHHNRGRVFCFGSTHTHIERIQEHTSLLRNFELWQNALNIFKRRMISFTLYTFGIKKTAKTKRLMFSRTVNV